MGEPTNQVRWGRKRLFLSPLEREQALRQHRRRLFWKIALAALLLGALGIGVLLGK